MKRISIVKWKLYALLYHVYPCGSINDSVTNHLIDLMHLCRGIIGVEFAECFQQAKEYFEKEIVNEL
jgi:hypothetical protein